MNEEIEEFLSKYDYDIRKSKNARWIDQKCTMDVLSIIADCIIEFLKDDKNKKFSVADIWYNQYTVDNVQMIFKKPNPKEKAKNEYDKWFGQPMKLLGYSKILNETKEGGKNYYTINNERLLIYISQRETNALNFLRLYIDKVLKDSGLILYFDNFFEKQDKEAFRDLKETFANFTINNTEINTKVECARIFTKVLNPLAFYKNKKGTERGFLSKERITIDMLQYNRYNWRDIDKPKDLTRKEYESKSTSGNEMTEYKIQKAKKVLRLFNEQYRLGYSEMNENGMYPKEGTMIHHIFPKADFPIIADYLENLIVLTPTQHFVKAHPNGNTNYIDKEYQYLLLVCKIGNIRENLISSETEKIYDFWCMTFVLDVGLNTNEFCKINNMDFYSVLTKLDLMYAT